MGMEGRRRVFFLGVREGITDEESLNCKVTQSLRGLRSGGGLVTLERGPSSSDTGGEPIGTGHPNGCHVANVHHVTGTVDSHPF